MVEALESGEMRMLFIYGLGSIARVDFVPVFLIFFFFVDVLHFSFILLPVKMG